MRTAADGPPEAVRQAWSVLDAGFEVEPGASGLLHRTLRLNTQAGERFVLQRVSDVFAPEIHDNIAAVTRHLAARGFATFRLVETRFGGPCLDLGEGGRWRLLTRLDGVTFDRLEGVAQARSAGTLVGRFHAALDDFAAPLAPMGIPFRDTPLYRRQLVDALARHAEHDRHAAVAALRERIEAGLSHLGDAPVTRARVIHADLKVSNVLFAGAVGPARDEAVALIDFDTLMRAPLRDEWGDAWRSWCNRRGEDEREAVFDLEVFAASLAGFVEGFGRPIERAERDSLVDATERIALELATRYATDALEESYFAWDREQFARAADHNLIRAEGQLSLYDAARACRDERAEILAATFPVERAAPV
ncbi:MAG: aminoglycoside phosphotransferase family protein [Myxococcota bacterium]